MLPQSGASFGGVAGHHGVEVFPGDDIAVPGQAFDFGPGQFDGAAEAVRAQALVPVRRK